MSPIASKLVATCLAGLAWTAAADVRPDAAATGAEPGENPLPLRYLADGTRLAVMVNVEAVTESPAAAAFAKRQPELCRLLDSKLPQVLGVDRSQIRWCVYFASLATPCEVIAAMILSLESTPTMEDVLDRKFGKQRAAAGLIQMSDIGGIKMCRHAGGDAFAIATRKLILAEDANLRTILERAANARRLDNLNAALEEVDGKAAVSAAFSFRNVSEMELGKLNGLPLPPDVARDLDAVTLEVRLTRQMEVDAAIRCSTKETSQLLATELRKWLENVPTTAPQKVRAALAAISVDRQGKTILLRGRYTPKSLDALVPDNWREILSMIP